MNLHVFGNPVRCEKCGQLALAVYSIAWDIASEGKGICEKCFADNQPDPTVIDRPATLPASQIVTDEQPTNG